MSWDDAPWTLGNLQIARSVLEELERLAVLGYTAEQEVCGLLAGPVGEPLVCDRIIPIENLAQQLHERDPSAYPRSARTFFAFHERKLEAALREGRAKGAPVKVLYHSHLDTGAYFSATDRAVMSMGEPPSEEGGVGRLGAGPAWPLAFLVVSVRATVVDDVRLFVWDGSDFVESPFSVVP